jgi:5-oxoprolinase (ATP-hydrolysing) subunit B
MSGRRIVTLGDAAVLVELAPEMSVAGSRQAVALAAGVRRAALPGVRDVVVTGASLAVHYDPLVTTAAALAPLLGSEVRTGDEAGEDAGDPVSIPVRYGGADGPDLEEVAVRCGCPASAVVERHSARVYRVAMMGFVPGFAYLWPLDERLRLPRRATPRTRVAAGSVAIAGAQTAVYPCETPGGWHLIGRTDAVLFDLARPEPFLLAVGRAVRFVPQ